MLCHGDDSWWEPLLPAASALTQPERSSANGADGLFRPPAGSFPEIFRMAQPAERNIVRKTGGNGDGSLLRTVIQWTSPMRSLKMDGNLIPVLRHERSPS